ncbi:type VI secretion system Vgr family protein [Burkholderia seminalis]|uniref:type VI secretion system Vgr family protein n=1 Tax=Burkholderia seminalis TaxID=488731 RepID=UPI00190644FE|nr:type VI secretion system tip protein TssI/VgrG [Burkholderia seminalis]MBJ9591618.1 type VI secretion system tip protein VgrG [Burkholderia seminalis]MCA8422330.1 type VI secretion system tip protein VgrG [Burkholderia seminalis]
MALEPTDSGSLRYSDIYEALNRGLMQHGRLLTLRTPLGDNALTPVRAKGWSKIGRDYRWTVDAVSTRDDIELLALMHQQVSLFIQQPTAPNSDAEYRPIHGFVYQIRRLGADGALSLYQIEFASALFFLGEGRDDYYWLDSDAVQSISTVFDKYPQLRGRYRFNLGSQPSTRTYTRQSESDLNLVHRLLEDEGWYFYWEHAPVKDSEPPKTTLVIVDSISALPEAHDVTYSRSNTGDEIGGLTQWVMQQTAQPMEFRSTSFDQDRPGSSFAAGSSMESTTYTVQHYRDKETLSIPGVPATVYEPTTLGYLDSDSGARRAQIRTQAWDAMARRFIGVGGVRWLDAGSRFVLNDHPRHDTPDSKGREFLAVDIHWFILNNVPFARQSEAFPFSLQPEFDRVQAEYEQASVSRPRANDGSVGFFLMKMEAQRTDVVYRSPLEHKKPAMQVEHLLVGAPDGEEAWTNKNNEIRGRFAWDRQSKPDDYNTSPWLRVMQGDTGDGYGAVHVPRKGEWVAVGYWQGDCDRPFVMGRLPGGTTQQPWHSDVLKSGQQSRGFGNTGAYNALIHDDSTHQGGQRLTSYTGGTYHLFHQGYLIDQTGNTRGGYRGIGYKLHTDAFGAMRANQGMAISTQHKSPDAEQLDVREARQQLSRAGNVVDSLSEASKGHQAADLKTGHDALKHFTDALELPQTPEAKGGRTAGGGTGTANAFKEPVMLLDSPAGIAASTQQSVHLAADQLINLVSGQTTTVASGQSLIVAALNLISIFAQNGGMKAIAGKGDIDIQAHAGVIDLAAQLALHIRSVTDVIEVASGKEIRILCGGAIIQISQDGSINIHSPGKIDFKAASYSFAGPARVDITNPAFKDSPVQKLSLNMFASPSAKNSAPIGMPYKLYADGALVKQGVFDETGQLPIDHHVATQKYTLELANGVKHEIPVPGDYHDAANGALANQGFQFHESSSAADITPPGDRALHRARYSELLNPSTGDEA